MEWMDVVLLVVTGAAGGFVGGLVGVGGGLIFAPVLFFYYQAVGIQPEFVAPLTIGTSLLCTLVVALSSAYSQYQKKVVVTRVALFVGASSVVSVFLMTRFVTTQPWYDTDVFQIVFSAVLLVVVIRMIQPNRHAVETDDGADIRAGKRPFALFASGTVAGSISAAVGVGGGIVMVPMYNHLLRLPIHRAAGTSSATIVLISLVGVLSYIGTGWGSAVTETSVGYVDLGRAMMLSLPAAVTARLGVYVAHRINRLMLRRSFAVVAMLVAVRLLWRVFE